MSPAEATHTQRRIALINQKGGVGKTTTTVNLGAALAELGQRVLMIDLDPQAHMSLHLGVDPDELEHSIYDLLTDESVSVYEVIQEVRENLSVLPANVNLAGVESELAEASGQGRAQRYLAERVGPLIDDQRVFDFVLLDCPPSLGLLTVNALALSREVVVPMQAHFLALQGLSKLLETVGLVRGSINPELMVSGVVLCMHDAQTLLAQEVQADLEQFFEESRDQDVAWRYAQVLTPAIRRNIKLAESPSHGQSILEYEPHSAGAQDYLALARNLIKLGAPGAAAGAVGG